MVIVMLRRRRRAVHLFVPVVIVGVPMMVGIVSVVIVMVRSRRCRDGLMFGYAGDELRRRDAGAEHTRSADVTVLDRKAAQRFAQRPGW